MPAGCCGKAACARLGVHIWPTLQAPLVKALCGLHPASQPASPPAPPPYPCSPGLQSVRVWEGLQQIGLLSPQGYLLADPSEETVS